MHVIKYAPPKKNQVPHSTIKKRRYVRVRVKVVRVRVRVELGLG